VILLVSVSARMLAELATREGHDVFAVDRFGDLDLQRLAPSVSILRDLGGRGGMTELVEAAERIPAAGVVYGAGLENRPDLVDRLAAGRALLGCTPETLGRVRDPGLVAASLRSGGFAYPRTLSAGEAPLRAESGRRWLRKPVRGGGGRGVHEWRGGRLTDGVVVQERISGVPCSAAAVADGRSAAVVGVSEQLIGRPAFGARGFKWCGNLVPPRLPARERHALAHAAQAICAHLAAAFALRGLFGVDLVWDGARPWVVEVNPRPTAALETIEAVHRVGSFGAHLAACAGRLPAAGPARSVADQGGAAGKAVLYATEDVRVADTRGWPARGIRDVPHPGEPIARGRPICTLVATGRTPEAVLADLEARAAALRAELHDRVAADAVA
jgi:predicted ATP-grasp superfamily ATP-dependent carboligase